MIATKAHAFIHEHLSVNFTCACGKWFSPKEADFTEREFVECQQCGRRHYPTIHLVTHEPRKKR